MGYVAGLASWVYVVVELLKKYTGVTTLWAWGRSMFYIPMSVK